MFFQHRSSFLLAGLLALGLGSCGPSANSPNQAQETNNETAEATSQEELQIVTTFLPMTHFTKAVVRDRDEAPAGLDFRGESDFYQLLYELKKEQDWAILQISHDLDMVRRHCDRIFDSVRGAQSRDLFSSQNLVSRFS
jgi:ABC-type glutathione transport system ATPase component